MYFNFSSALDAGEDLIFCWAQHARYPLYFENRIVDWPYLTFRTYFLILDVLI